jgi:DnaJ-class molecular chaperone
MNSPISFADLETSLDDIEVRVSTGKFAKTEKFPCGNCNGSGLYQRVRIHEEREHCFACNGKGYFLTSAADRAAARGKRILKKEDRKSTRLNSSHSRTR